jgi:hypothetical protein
LNRATAIHEASLFPSGYAAEPKDLPSLTLVWVQETHDFAVVRFFQNVSDSVSIVPLVRRKTRLAADRTMTEICKRLALELGTR